MSGYFGQLGLVVVLMLANAVFAGSEMALVTLRESQVRRLEEASGGGKVLARLARDPNRFLSTIQIGITLAGFLASATAAVALAKPLVEPLSFLGRAASPVSVVLVTMALTFATLVIGELAPKRIAMQRAEGWALLAARPLDWLSKLSRPMVWLLGKSTNAVVRVAGVDPHATSEEVSPEEIRDLVAAQQNFTPEQRTIISGAFEITDRIVREILIPRRDVVSLPEGTSCGEAVHRLREAGHSRAPVVGAHGLDDVIGLVHMRDLIDAADTVENHTKECMIVPDTLKVSDALRQMRAQREQFAAVADEYGSVDGIITMEDLVEEVVGEIYDETDRDITAVITEADGAKVIPGAFPLHDLPDLDIHIERDEGTDYTTIAGLIIDHLGHIPTAAGEVVELGNGVNAEVVEVQRNAIIKVRLRRRETSESDATQQQ